MTTRHDAAICRMSFGRPKPETGCPRCAELAAGAAPRKGWTRRNDDRARIADIRAHFASHQHRSCGCGPVCTYGEY